MNYEQKYLKYKNKYLNLQQILNNQSAGSFENKKMLIFTTNKDRIYSYDVKNNKYTLPESKKIEEQLKSVITYILYEGATELICISDNPNTTKVIKGITLNNIFMPIFNGLKEFSKEACIKYYVNIDTIFTLTNTTHIIGIDINKVVSNKFYFDLSRENITGIRDGVITEKSNEYIKIITDYNKMIQLNNTNLIYYQKEIDRNSTSKFIFSSEARKSGRDNAQFSIDKVMQENATTKKEYNEIITEMKEKKWISQLAKSIP
jgi:hypothetical protein